MLEYSLQIGSVTEETVAARTQRIPMGRYAEASEIASVVLFLCSPAASYVTGETIYVDGAITVNADAPLAATADSATSPSGSSWSWVHEPGRR